MSNPLHPESEEQVVAVRNGSSPSRALAATERPAPQSYVEEAPPFAFDEEEQQWTMQRLVALFFRRRAIILGVFTTVLALFVITALLTPRVYRSGATVLISAQSKAGDPMGMAFGGMLDAQSRSQATEIEILQSKPVREAAMKLLPPDLRSARLVALDVRARAATDLVDVNTNSTDPKFAQQFTKALCEAYIQQAKRESRRQYGDTAEYVSSQVVIIRAKMDEASNNLRRFKEQTGISDLETATAAQEGNLQTVQAALKTAQVELAAGQSQLQRLIATIAALPRYEKAPSVYTKSAVAQQLETKLTALQGQLNEARQEFTGDSPEVRSLLGEISQTRAQLARAPKQEVTSSTNTPNGTRQGLEQQAAQLRATNVANISRIAALRAQVAQARTESGTLPQQEQRLNQLILDQATYQEAYKTLNEKLVNLRINEAAPVSKARVQTPADVAYQVRPNLRNSVLGGIFIGLILALITAIIVDRMDNRIHSEDDVRMATGLPILAFIPRVSHFEDESIIALAANSNENQHTPLLESYRMLRTSLMFTVLNSPLRCIMLTSSQPHEGKSSVAANLATVLAMNGKTVLLIDADLRRPSAHRLFGLSGEQGFTNVAAGLCSLEDAVQNTTIPGLRVLAVGPTPPNPPEMLDSRQGRALFQNAREMADFVIIDAPPALMMADAQIIATEADGVLLVVSWEEALKDAVSRTNDLLSRTGAKMLGVVVNKWDDRQAAYQNYYQKHYKAFDDGSSSSKK